ncbi:MAG: PAS domain S-box protein [Sphingobacteriales bacterium]
MYSLQKNKTITITGLLGIVTGIVVIIGWLFSLPGLETIYPHYVSMRFNTALCFVLLGAALITTQVESNKYNKLIFLVLSITLTVFSALSLSQDIFHFNSGIDQLFVADKLSIAEKYPFPGRMAINVSCCFALCGLALVGFSIKNQLVNILSQYFLHLVTAISSVAIIGYLYGLSLFYKLTFVSSMAIHSAVLLFLISIIATLLRPSLGITNLFTGQLVGNKMARRLFVLMVLMVLVFGALRIQSERNKILSSAVGVSFLAVCFIFVSLLLIWYTASHLNRIDLKRYEAEEEITVMNEELEERVAGRSAELLDLLEKFKESESRFRTAFEFSAIGMALVSLEGKWLKVNKSLCGMLGYSEHELLSMTFMDITYPADLEESVKTKEKSIASESEPSRVEKRYVRKNGTIVWASVNMATVKDNNGRPQYLVSQVEDITERKKINARFRAIVESDFVAIKLNDIEGNIIYRSPSMQAINGWTDEEINRNYFKLTHPEDLELIKKVHEVVLSNPGKSVNITYRIQHKNGNYIWIESMLCNKLSDPDLGAIITVTRDVTDRKRMEAGLMEAEIKFRTLAEKSMVGVYISQKERFTYVNPRFAEIFGYEPKELINTGESAIDMIISKDDQSMVKKKILARYKGEADNAHYEVKGKKKDGTHNFIEFYGSRVIIDGEASIIGTMLDITERKKAEELILREKTLSETIINSLPEVFYLRNAKGEFLRWNKNFEKITGYTAEEIKKLDSRKQLAEEDRGMIQDAVKKMYIEGSATVEARVVTKQGGKVPFLITITPLIYENQECLIGIAIDITSRLKAEEELRSSEHKYKSLFESNPLPMWMVAKDSLSVIAVNDAAAKLYGYTKDELLKMDVTGFRPVEDFGLQLEEWDKNANDLTGDRIIRHYKKDGTMMFVQIIARDIVFEGKQVRLAFTNDVTEKLKAEESLQKTQANLKAIMDTTDTSYVLLDKKLRIIAFNQMAVEFIKAQYNHTPAKREKFTDFLPEERLLPFARNVDAVLKGKHIGYEINYPQPDGSELWYFIKIFPITNDKHEIFGLLIAVSEITERKKAEESLKAAYHLIQDHIGSIKDMAWKQSHLIRSPVANLKALAALLNEDPADSKILQFINLELDRLDSVIIDMAEDASNHGL